MRPIVFLAALVLSGAAFAQTADQQQLLAQQAQAAQQQQATDTAAASSAGPVPSVALSQAPSLPSTNSAVAASPTAPGQIASANSTGGFITLSDGVVVPVFGTDLFTGAYAGTRPGDRPDYVIQPGDQISINIFGAVNVSGVQPVDAAGNVFVPGVGPVHVGGLQASQLQSAISGKVRTFYTPAVGVYAQIIQAGSIGVFVTGDVLRPGRYLGGPQDTVLYFLSQAGGVDPARGSFRNVVVQRNGAPIATYDLYDFLLAGRTDPIRFRDGDVVVVAPRGAMIGVTGQGRNAFAFEAPRGAPTMTGADLLPLARPEPTVTSVALRGFRGGAPQSAYYPLQDFRRVILRDADHVDLRSDVFNEVVTVAIEGEVRGPNVVVVPRGSMLSQVLAQIDMQNSDVEPRWVHLRRPGVAAEQKRAINDALYNLQKQLATMPAYTPEQAALAQAQGQLLRDFIAAARQVQPEGNVSVYTKGQFNDVRLFDGDTIVLPRRTDVVLVAGEVVNPGGLAFARGANVADYVGRAGGFTPAGNSKRIVIRHPDGSAEVGGRGTQPGPGDTLVVVPKVASPWLQIAKDVTQILFQTAVTAGTVIRLTDDNNN
jgi:protein involved in polysaccharide export with SLBB domain